METIMLLATMLVKVLLTYGMWVFGKSTVITGMLVLVELLLVTPVRTSLVPSMCTSGEAILGSCGPLAVLVEPAVPVKPQIAFEQSDEQPSRV